MGLAGAEPKAGFFAGWITSNPKLPSSVTFLKQADASVGMRSLSCCSSGFEPTALQPPCPWPPPAGAFPHPKAPFKSRSEERKGRRDGEGREGVDLSSDHNCCIKSPFGFSQSLAGKAKCLTLSPAPQLHAQRLGKMRGERMMKSPCSWSISKTQKIKQAKGVEAAATEGKRGTGGLGGLSRV